MDIQRELSDIEDAIFKNIEEFERRFLGAYKGAELFDVSFSSDRCYIIFIDSGQYIKTEEKIQDVLEWVSKRRNTDADRALGEFKLI